MDNVDGSDGHYNFKFGMAFPLPCSFPGKHSPSKARHSSEEMGEGEAIFKEFIVCEHEPSGFCHMHDVVMSCGSCQNSSSEENSFVLYSGDMVARRRADVSLKGSIVSNAELRYYQNFTAPHVTVTEKATVLIMDWKAVSQNNFFHVVLLALYRLTEALLRLEIGTDNLILLTDVQSHGDAGVFFALLQLFSDRPITTSSEFFKSHDQILCREIVYGITTGKWGPGIDIHAEQRIQTPHSGWVNMKSFIFKGLGISCQSPPLFLTVVQRTGRSRQIKNIWSLAKIVNGTRGLSARILIFEKISLIQQIEMVIQSGLLVGMHGAGLTHMVFMQQGSGVVELFPNNTNPSTHPAVCYQNLAKSVGMIHAHLHADDSECMPSSGDPRHCMQNFFSPFKFDVTVRSTAKMLMSVPELLDPRYRKADVHVPAIFPQWATLSDSTHVTCQEKRDQGRQDPNLIFERDFVSRRSQGREDEKAFKNYFPDCIGGRFLEMGALDGVTFSNTYAFDKDLGWKGVLIEADPENFATLKLTRPDQILVNAAICDERQVVHFVSSGDGAVRGIKEFMAPKFFKAYHLDKYGKTARVQEHAIVCWPLMDILEYIGLMRFDLWSIDVEGGEAMILRGVDFTKVIVDVIVIEADGLNRSKDMEVISRLQKDYVLHSKDERNLWWIRKHQ